MSLSLHPQIPYFQALVLSIASLCLSISIGNERNHGSSLVIFIGGRQVGPRGRHLTEKRYRGTFFFLTRFFVSLWVLYYFGNCKEGRRQKIYGKLRIGISCFAEITTRDIYLSFLVPLNTYLVYWGHKPLLRQNIKEN